MLWTLVAVLIAGLGRGGLNYIPWSIYNYMADVDQIVTGRRREGGFAGVMTFARKTTQAVAVIFVGQILNAAGFLSQSATQSQNVIHAIVLIMVGGTLLVLAGGFLVSLRFHLNDRTHEVLMAEIERFKTGELEPLSDTNQAIVEDLTGWRYDQLWDRNPVGRKA